MDLNVTRSINGVPLMEDELTTLALTNDTIRAILSDVLERARMQSLPKQANSSRST